MPPQDPHLSARERDAPGNRYNIIIINGQERDGACVAEQQ
jgi:hypothetical protein